MKIEKYTFPMNAILGAGEYFDLRHSIRLWWSLCLCKINTANMYLQARRYFVDSVIKINYGLKNLYYKVIYENKRKTRHRFNGF